MNGPCKLQDPLVSMVATSPASNLPLVVFMVNVSVLIRSNLEPQVVYFGDYEGNEYQKGQFLEREIYVSKGTCCRVCWYGDVLQQK